ncbi:MAG: sulfotransferase [Candidatus Aminicenantes bacterium]|nr:sulfotransferase [Candidatus Aminicenantes bacterium]
MKVCILGVGRSGTTALYCLIQEMMIDHYGENIDFIYEPFLWDKAAFNGKHVDVIGHFKKMDSISFEGIYFHQKLPLFIKNPGKYKKNEYLKNIFFNRDSSRHVLIKFIRANGRFLLLNKICGNCKFIFITRNPLDVINSAIIRFSLLGSEYHRDDFKRLISEINLIYGTNYKSEKVNTQVEKEVLYWFYMNKFALDSFRKIKEKPLIICHEDYVSRRECWVDTICSFLDLPRKDRYYDFSKKRGGSKTGRVTLDKHEFKLLAGYIEKYKELLKNEKIGNNINFNRLITKYEKSLREKNREKITLGKTPNYMNNLLKKKEKEIRAKNEEIWDLKQRLTKLETEIKK